MQPDLSSRPSVPPSSRRPSAPPALLLSIGARTDVGLSRDHNEDSFLVTSLGASALTVNGDEALEVAGGAWAALAVCDGMGGAASGEVASRRAVEVIDEILGAGGHARSRDELGRRLIRCLEEASRRIHEDALADRGKRGMGTTATLCALRGEALLVAQIGDSRAYLYRAGVLHQMTRDQTLTQMMIESGQLAPEEARDFVYGNIILQAVGTAPRVEVDLTEAAVRRGDVLLVCSDGLHGPVTDEEIGAVLGAEPTPALAAEQLIRRAIAAGAPDNVTCIVARIEGGDLREPAEPPVAKKAILSEESRAAADTDPAIEVTPSPRSEGPLQRFLGLFRR